MRPVEAAPGLEGSWAQTPTHPFPMVRLRLTVPNQTGQQGLPGPAATGPGPVMTVGMPTQCGAHSRGLRTGCLLREFFRHLPGPRFPHPTSPLISARPGRQRAGSTHNRGDPGLSPNTPPTSPALTSRLSDAQHLPSPTAARREDWSCPLLVTSGETEVQEERLPIENDLRPRPHPCAGPR